ncbi:MAG: VCBS repeat-containing protein, partial [Saprospiraceae bacterium]
MRTYYSIFVSLLLSTVCLFGQNFERLNIPISKQGQLLPLALAGGIKAAQFSNFDFNNDGTKDLFVFERNGDKIIPLVKTGAKGILEYKFAPEYIPLFPKLQNWALLVDFNHDGIQDIFTSSSFYPSCIEVWRGQKDNTGRLTYKMIRFNYGIPEIVQFPITGGFTNIYVSSIDMPGIADVDGDGDIDIISFEPDGSFASFYQNLSVEENLGLDSLKYVRKDICWGKFSENQFNEDIKLSDNAFSCAQGISDSNPGVRHSGSTLCIFDMDGDQDMDLLIGDLASSRIKKLTNGGTATQALMSKIDATFPSEDLPIFLDLFLAAYYVDVDGDNIRDLVVCPNDINSGETENHLWLYINTGTDAAPIFKFRKNNFLIDQMVFFNSGTHPAFGDINGDGLLDIIVGSNGVTHKDGKKTNKMYLMINTGTKSNPSYNIIDENYLAFDKFGQFTGRFAPALGDIDHDGDLDLFVGDTFGQLYFLNNTAGKGNPSVFDPPVYPFADIFVGQNAKPQIIDLDGDGLHDLVIGEKNNQLNFFKNTGTKSQPKFEKDPEKLPNTTKLGNIFTGNDFFTQNGAPYFIQE